VVVNARGPALASALPGCEGAGRGCLPAAGDPG